jgi:outer membrane protein assembly complex protein YaeT
MIPRSHRRSYARFRTLICGLAAFLLALLTPWSPAGSAEGESRGIIEHLDFEGVAAIPEAEIRNHLLMDLPTWKPWGAPAELDEMLLAHDVDRIPVLYRRFGYYEARARYELEWNEARTEVRVLILVDEGEAVRVTAVEINLALLPGETSTWQSLLLGDLRLKPGAVLDLRSYGETKELLLLRLADAAYPTAELEGGAEVDLATHRAVVRWRVLPGPRVRFGAVEIAGLERLDEKLVRPELALEEGDAFSRTALRKSQRQIYELGLFRSVVVETRRGTTDGDDPDPAQAEREEVWPVEIRLTERPPRSVRAGVGYGTEENLRARLAWQHRNLFGSATRLELSARYSSLRGAVEASLEQRRFIDPLVTASLKAAVERETPPSYEADSARLTAGLRRPLGGAWSGRVGYTFEWNQTRDVSDAADVVLDDPEATFLLSHLEAGLERVSLDDPGEPSRGSRLDLLVQLSPAFLGSQVQYAKLFAEGRKFVPIWGAVLATHLRLGTIEPLWGTQADEIPLVVRLFSGGSNSVRGFDYQELGPRDASGEPLGGTSIAEASIEVRVPLWRQLGAVFFSDAGQVNLEPFSWDVSEIFYSVGAGIRYRTPVGPLRVDFGYVLNPENELDRRRIHLSIGHAF